MNGFLPTLARLTATRKKQNRVRETLVGLAVGGLLVAGGSLSLEWTLWTLVLYFVGVQAVALSENDVFCDFFDFRLLGFREASVRYRVAYLVHYLARDMFVANAFALTVAVVGLIVLGQPWAAASFVVVWAVNMAIVPSHVHLAFRLAERARVSYIAGLLIAALLLLVPLVAGWRLAPEQLPMLPAFVIAFGVLHTTVVDMAAARIRGTGLVSYGGREAVAWLAPRVPHLFKDLLLFHGMAIQSLLAGVALFALLAMGSPTVSMPALVLLALGHDNLFLGRLSKAYRLVAEDSQFTESKLPADRAYLRRTKLVTLAFDLPVKLATAAALLAALGPTRWELYPVLALVMATILVVTAPLPYLAEPLTRFMRGTVGYALMCAFAVGSLIGVMTPVAVGCLLVAALYAPSAILAYAPRRRRAAPAPGSARSPLIDPRQTVLT